MVGFRRLIACGVLGALVTFVAFLAAASAPAFAQSGTEGPAPAITSVVTGGMVRPGAAGRIVVKVEMGGPWHVNAHEVRDK